MILDFRRVFKIKELHPKQVNTGEAGSLIRSKAQTMKLCAVEGGPMGSLVWMGSGGSPDMPGMN